MSEPVVHNVAFEANPVQKAFILSEQPRVWWRAQPGEGKTAGCAWAAFQAVRTASTPCSVLVTGRDPSGQALAFLKWFPDRVVGSWDAETATFTWSPTLKMVGSVAFLPPHALPPGSFDVICWEGPDPPLDVLETLLAPGGRIKVAAPTAPAAGFEVLETETNENLHNLPADWLARRAAHDGLMDYARFIQIPGVPERPVTLAAHHKIILTALQEVEAGRVKRVMLFLPPGSAKSTYTSVVFTTWFMGRNPGADIVSVSYASDLAQKFGRYCRTVVRSPEFRSIFGTELSGESTASDRWALLNGANYRAFGMLSGITGNRADGVLIDDPVRGREDADSQLMRDKTWDAYLSDVRTRLKPHAWIAIIQTRWHEDDLSGRILPEGYNGESGWVTARDGEQWFVINIPAQAEREDDPLQRKPGEWLWPEWWPAERWEQERKTQMAKGTRNWASLYQQRPTPEEGDYFQREWIKFYDLPPALETLRVYGASDYAVTESGGDYTVHGVVGVDPDDNIYVLDWWRGQKSSDVWVDAFLGLCQKWKPVEWAEEAGQINKSVGPFISKQQREKGIYTYRRQYSSTKDKPTRAQAIRARMAMGKVFLPRTEWAERLVSEMLTFPAGKNDDQVDVMSLIGRILDRMVPGQRTEKPQPAKMTTMADVTLNMLWKDAAVDRESGFIR